MIGTTTFTNERKAYNTTLEGDTLVMKGTTNIGSSDSNFSGQIYSKENGSYVGDYSTNNISISQVTRAGAWVEAAQMMEQLQKDIDAKAKEVQA